MSTWILIAIFHIGSGGASVTIDFPSKASCEDAMAQINAQEVWDRVQQMYCVERKAK